MKSKEKSLEKKWKDLPGQSKVFIITGIILSFIILLLVISSGSDGTSNTQNDVSLTIKQQMQRDVQKILGSLKIHIEKSGRTCYL